MRGRVRFTIFELELDFQSTVKRYQLRPLNFKALGIENRAEHARRFLGELCDVICLEKKRQLALPQEFWPDVYTSEMRAVMSVPDMPMLVWLAPYLEPVRVGPHSRRRGA